MNAKLLKNIKAYTLRILVFTSVIVVLAFVFMSDATFKTSMKTIAVVLPNQTATDRLYDWKVEYFSKKSKKSASNEQTAIEKEFEVNTIENTQASPPQPQALEIPASAYTDQIIRHSYYTLAYCEANEQARWVAYLMTFKNLEKNAERRDEKFQSDPKVLTGSALPLDYTGSGYDRGHLAPAGDFTGNVKMMQETFYMSNMSPQRPLCNRETWRVLEEQTRRWAEKKGDLYIVSGPVFAEKMSRIGRKNKIAVPPAYFKIILSYSEKKGIAFIVPNLSKKENYRDYQVSIDEVEKQTGLDFFPLLPDDLEEKIESSTDNSDWFSLSRKKKYKDK